MNNKYNPNPTNLSDKNLLKIEWDINKNEDRNLNVAESQSLHMCIDSGIYLNYIIN
jgi:hypothetical protein